MHVGASCSATNISVMIQKDSNIYVIAHGFSQIIFQLIDSCLSNKTSVWKSLKYTMIDLIDMLYVGV